MGDFLSGCAASITRDLVCGAVNELRYPCCFNNLVEDLQKEKDKVAERRNSVQERIDHAKKQTKNTAGFVHTWLKDANTDIDNAEELLKKARTNKSCCFGHCPNWIWRYRLGKQLLSDTQRMTKICNEEGGNYVQIERDDSLPGLGYFPSMRCIKFESRQYAREQLMKALESDKFNMIGLYGMGGCGKTTLAIDVGKIAKKEELFDEVIFVVVSSTVEVQRIQEDIASGIGCELKEKNEMQRAQRLHKRLILEEKVLVILDNVWERLDFLAIGIPSWKNHKGCKVLITTRSKDVCNAMYCQSMISLQLLNDEDAWRLFQIQAHISEATSDNLKDLARRISNECAGLPVAITAVASTLEGKAEVEWNVALDRLRSSKKVNIEKGLPNPYECLKLSYDNLDIKEAKSLFLLCSVFPEEYEIPVEDLTRFAIGLGLIGEIHSYEPARNEVCAAKTKLINCCLLLDAGEGKCVKMHDLIRKVAHSIAEYGDKGVRCVLEKDVTVECTKLRYLWCEKFPYQFDCSNLEFLCINTYLEVSDEIFKGMKRLRVLFLINKGLEKRSLLIKSFQSSTNLRCLLLENWKLGDISFVGDSEKLESLTLRKCSFLGLPYIPVTPLSRLRLLDLSDCDMEGNPFEVIGRNPQLEELYIDDCRSEWDLYEESTADLFSMFRVPRALQRYHIHLGTEFVGYEEKLLNCCRTLFLSCFDTSNAAIKDLARKTEVLRIANIRGGGAKNIVPDIFQIDGGGMNALIELMIHNSDEIEHLVDTGNHLSQVGTLLSGLRKLRMKDMEHLRSLYNGQPPNGLFEKLEELYIEDCPELHGTLFVWKLDLCSLKVLELYTCSKLTSLLKPAVARSLVQLERLKILYCDELKHILEDDDTEEISKNDDKLVLSKLKKITVRGCSKLEYIIPVTFAHGLLQLESLKIEANPELKYVFGQCKHDNQSHNEIKIDLPLLKKLILVNLPDISSLCPKNCHLVLSNVQSMNLQYLEQMEVSGERGLLNLHLESNQLEDFTSIPSAPLANHNSGSLNLCNLKRLILRSCSMLRTLFSPSTAIHLTSLEELMIGECHELRYLVTYGKAHENKGEIIQEDHDSQSYVAMFPRLERIGVVNCSLLECIFHVSYVQGLVELKVIEIQQTPSLIYVFGHSIHDNDGVPSFHQYQNKIKIELPALEKVALVSLPNMINICPDNYYVRCSSLRQVVMEDVGLSTLSVNNLMVYSGSTYLDHSSTSDIMEASMTNVQVLGSVAIWNSSKMKGIFHQDEIPMNGQQATSWLIDLKLFNLPELAYIWKGAKQFATLQNLKSLYIWGCQKLKVIFSSSVSRSLPQLKILVVRQCEGLQQIVEDDEEHENESNTPTAPKISFSKLKLLLVTQCDNLKRLFYLSKPHEFPELEYLIINEDPNLEEVFEGEQGVREGNVEVLLPKLKHLILMQLPNLNNISQWIEFQTLTNLFVHNCPKLSLTSTTTVENMLQSFSHDKEIDLIVHCDLLLYMFDIINKESDEKDQTASEFSNSELRRQSTTSLATREHKIPSLKLAAQQSTSEPSFLDQQHELGETIVTAEVAQISTIFIPTHDVHCVIKKSGPLKAIVWKKIKKKTQMCSNFCDVQSIEDVTKESIKEGSTSEEAMKANLSDITEGNGLDVVIVTHTKPSGGGDMLAQQSHVDDSIQVGSNLMDKEGETSVVSNDIIEVFPAASADTGRSHSLTTAELRAYKDFDDMDDAQIALLEEAITLYPHLWNVCGKFSKRFQAWMLKTLADMLLFLRNESPVSVTLTPQRENEFHRLCDEAVQLGFDKSWVDGMRQRVIVRVPEVDLALARARLGELHKRNEQLTQELHEIKSEIDNLNDFLAAQERCFDFL